MSQYIQVVYYEARELPLVLVFSLGERDRAPCWHFIRFVSVNLKHVEYECSTCSCIQLELVVQKLAAKI